jgi:hypothetical protein
LAGKRRPARTHRFGFVDAAWEQPFCSLERLAPHRGRYSQTRLLCNLELHRRARLTLKDERAGTHLIALHHIFDAKMHEIAATQFAVDRKVEQRQITNAIGDLQPYTDGPNLPRLERRLLPGDLALVPRNEWLGGHFAGMHCHDVPPSLEDSNIGA